MKATEAFLEFQYEEIDVLDKEKGIYLVQDRMSKKIFVKKTQPVVLLEIYKEIRKIRHKNLLQVIDAYESKGVCVVIEEYVSGVSLAEILEQEQVLKRQKAVGYIQELCEALRELHQNHLVHRDVNPANIRITENGVLKLMDFDAVRRFQGAGKDTRLLGTVGYAAPEQFGFSESDVRTDIYAIGVLLNKMLTGQFPSDEMYHGDKQLERVIGKCTQLDKERRYNTVDYVLRDLQRGAKGYYWQMLYRQLPGVRSDNKVWKFISFWGYVAFFGGCFSTAHEDYMVKLLEQGNILGYHLILLTECILSFGALCNVGNYTERWLRLGNSSKAVRITVRIILFYMFIFIGLKLEERLC